MVVNHLLVYSVNLINMFTVGEQFKPTARGKCA
jgi:hypothetical protein